jgi:hypothetical protein
MEKLEEVLGSSMCEYSSIEKRLAILYRNQVKIYDAITKEQQGYSEEEVLEILYKHTEDLLAGKKLTLEEWFEQFKNK